MTPDELVAASTEAIETTRARIACNCHAIVIPRPTGEPGTYRLELEHQPGCRSIARRLRRWN